MTILLLIACALIIWLLLDEKSRVFFWATLFVVLFWTFIFHMVF